MIIELDPELPDRQLLRECPDGMTGRLQLGGRELPCLVTAISLSGASLRSLPCEQSVVLGADEVSLSIPEVGDGWPIGAALVRTYPDRATLAFRLDPDSELYLRAFLSERPVPTAMG